MLETWKSALVAQVSARIRESQSAITVLLCAISSENIKIAMVRLRALEIDQEKDHAQRTEQADILLSSLSETREAVNTIKTIFGSIDSNFRAMREGRVMRNIRKSGVDDEDTDGEDTTHVLARGSADSQPEANDLAILTTKVPKLSVREKVFMREEAILASLCFEKRSFQHDHIPSAHKKTFRWIFDQSAAAQPDVVGRFARWPETGTGPFWITGKPGPGESTLMKLIAKHVSEGGLLANWAAPKKLVLACHFFWSAGTTI